MNTRGKVSKMSQIPYNRIFQILVVGTLLTLFLIAVYSDDRIQNVPLNYSVATITDFGRGGKSGPWFNYEFELKNRKYTSSCFVEGKMSMESGSYLRSFVGKRFLVKFEKGNPGLNRLLINCPVNDDIQPSAAGWEAPPFECDEGE